MGLTCLAVPVLGAVPACHQEAPATTSVTAAELEAAPRLPVAARGPTVLARAISRVIATSDERVYFGDAARGALVSVPKRGGDVVQVGAPAPLDLAFGPGWVAWIGAPGTAVVRSPPRGEPLIGRGTFTALAAYGGELFVTEAEGREGALLEIRGDRIVRRTTFASRPREVAVDALAAYVVTDDGIHRVPREGGEATLVVAGQKLTGLALGRDSVFTTDAFSTTRGLVRVGKLDTGGTVIAREVRNAPIAFWDGQVYFFDEKEPALLRVPASGGSPSVVARSPELGWAVDLAVDASGVYVAVAYERGGAILALEPASR